MFSVKIYPGKYFIENHKKVSVLYKEIEAIDKDVLPIPLVNQEEWDVATRIHSQLPACRMSEIADLTRGEINQTIFSEYITKNPSHTEMIKGVEIDRYAEHWHLSQGEKQWFDEKSYSAQVKNAKNIPNFRIGVQRITGIDERTRLRATLFERRVYFADSTNSVASEDIARLRFLLALINSCLFNWRFKLTSTNNNVSTNELDRVPVRLVNFTTPEGERKDLADQVRMLYGDYLRSSNFVQLGALLSACLPQKADGSPDMDHEKSDVVHDLLAFLAAEMTRLNKEEQAAIKAFLTWLEKEILKGSVEDQKNKTKIRNFHEGTFEDLLDILKKNNVVPDPCPSQTRTTILAEFTAATNILTPLLASITTTDKLIDQIVYRFYGLSDEEITIVEG